MKRTCFFQFLSLAFLAGWNSAHAVLSEAHPPGMLGVHLHEIAAEDVASLNLPGEFGAFVEAVGPGSPAEQAGISAGDVIVGFNSERVQSARALRRMVSESPAGRTVELRLIRGGRPLLLPVVLGEGREVSTHPAAPAAPQPRRFGAWVESVGAQLADILELEDGTGLVVTEVMGGSVADRAGVQARDILVSIGGTAISSPEALAEMLQSFPGNRIELELIRSMARQTVTLQF